MKNGKVATFGIILIVLLLCTLLMAGCTENSGSQTERTASSAETLAAMKAAAGEQVLSITGSTTVLPIAARVAEKYMDTYPEIDVQVSGGGTGAGVQSAGVGTAMLGMASRDLKPEEKAKYPDLVAHQIAIDGIAIITNADNPIPSLTLDQVKDIYGGTIRNWKDVGGKDAAIVVVGRDSASGTREFFYTDVMKQTDFVRTQLEKNSNGAVKQTIEQTPHAVGYVGLGYIDQSVHAVPLSLNGTLISPTVESVKAGSYPISRPLHFLTRGKPTGDVAAFLAFMGGVEGQKIITEEGFIVITH